MASFKRRRIAVAPLHNDMRWAIAKMSMVLLEVFDWPCCAVAAKVLWQPRHFDAQEVDETLRAMAKMSMATVATAAPVERS